jgi:hypothetical protein
VDVIRKGNSVIKRIGLLLVVSLVAAMMLAATAAPSFAARTTTDPNEGPRGVTTTSTGNGGGSGTIKCQRHGKNGAIISETGNQCDK